MPLVSPAYCTAAELRRFMSAQAVTDFADHDNDGIADDDVVEDAINWAVEEINGYLQERYEPSGLVNSTLVNRCCVLMAARNLCITRGNAPPEPWEAEYERLVDAERGMFMRIKRGEYELPGVPKRSDMRPTWSNLVVDRRHARQTVRVVRDTSSSAPSALPQHFQVDVPRGLP